MKILIQSVRILDPNSPFHKKTRNVLINNGRIADIGEKNFSADKVIHAEGMLLTIGWFDVGTYAGDPGLEQKEDLESVALAAAAGGFTELAVLPNTVPAVQHKNDIKYLTRGNAQRLVQIHPMASVTRNNEGKELTEMIDLHTAGAVAFTDGLKTIWHTDIFLKALQYLQPFNGVLIDHPEDIWLNMFGQMHEGEQSTLLGLKGMPRLAEEVAIHRNLDLLKYAGGKLHISRLSSARSVALIRSVKEKLSVTCDVAAYQPLLDDTMLKTFDTNFKVNPPLREKRDNRVLIKGLQDGTIDVICSGHVPQDDESKMVEFDHAEPGMINLQTFGANLVDLSKHLEWPKLMEKVTSAPRNVLGLKSPQVDVNQEANLTLFNPSCTWKFDANSNLSKSKNSPWFGKQVTGKVEAVFNNGHYRIFG
ncbi:MAG: dihydroorotase [Cyclobacteriaceae bacterium]|jgi:dihydroorotase|nr:dihydroorotase [Cyclobacteriaceae bacterium]